MAQTQGGTFNPTDDIVFSGAVTFTNATSQSGTLVTTTGSQTVTNKNLTAPTITGTVAGNPTITAPVLTTPTLTAPSGTASTGVMITKSGVITELTGDGTYTITVAVPAGAWIHDIRVTNQALWTAGTSATLKVGDTANDDGYFIGGNMKATDLPLGEVLSVMDSTMWGGLEGAYLVAATGQRGPVATNFGLYYAAGSNILFAVVKAGTGTAGRTAVSVTYSIGEVIAQVVT